MKCFEQGVTTGTSEKSNNKKRLLDHLPMELSTYPINYPFSLTVHPTNLSYLVISLFHIALIDPNGVNPQNSNGDLQVKVSEGLP